jgi:hypothetical protein
MGSLEIGNMAHPLLGIDPIFVIFLGCLGPAVLLGIIGEYARWPHESSADPNSDVSVCMEVDGVPVQTNGGFSL